MCIWGGLPKLPILLLYIHKMGFAKLAILYNQPFYTNIFSNILVKQV